MFLTHMNSHHTFLGGNSVSLCNSVWPWTHSNLATTLGSSRSAVQRLQINRVERTCLAWAWLSLNSRTANTVEKNDSCAPEFTQNRTNTARAAEAMSRVLPIKSWMRTMGSWVDSGRRTHLMDMLATLMQPHRWKTKANKMAQWVVKVLGEQTWSLELSPLISQ